MHGPHNLSSKHARRIFSFHEFTFHLNHKSGAQNKVVDALNRRYALLNSMKIEIIGFDPISEATKTDPDFNHVYILRSGQQVPPYSFHDGYLFHGTSLCIFDGSLRHFVMQETHNFGHFGIDKPKTFLKDRCYWPSLDRYIAYYVERCQVCQRGEGQATNGAYTPLPIPSKHRSIYKWILLWDCLGACMDGTLYLLWLTNSVKWLISFHVRSPLIQHKLLICL